MLFDIPTESGSGCALSEGCVTALLERLSRTTWTTSPSRG
jgi:hypothetical protein